MKRLWAPWRMAYIMDEKLQGCIFCEKPQEQDDVGNYILYRGRSTFVIMNRYPYTNGHLLITPYRHVDCLSKLLVNETREISLLLQKSLELLKAELKTDGFNVGANIGKAAGAGIEEHFHVHIVPRWNGDINFVPILAETKVLPEDLPTTYGKLLPHFKQLQLPQ